MIMPLCRYILEARELPILAMIKRIFNQLTTRMCNKRDEALLFTGPICSKIQKKLDKYIELSNNCYPLETEENNLKRNQARGEGSNCQGMGSLFTVATVVLQATTKVDAILTKLACHQRSNLGRGAEQW